MKADQYAEEVEFVVRQVEHETLDLVAAWARIQLLTIAYRSEGSAS